MKGIECTKIDGGIVHYPSRSQSTVFLLRSYVSTSLNSHSLFPPLRGHTGTRTHCFFSLLEGLSSGPKGSSEWDLFSLFFVPTFPVPPIVRSCLLPCSLSFMGIFISDGGWERGERNLPSRDEDREMKSVGVDMNDQGYKHERRSQIWYPGGPSSWPKIFAYYLLACSFPTFT